MLLSVSVNVNARDQQGNTALLEAARNGHSDIITALMARGARLNLDGQGQAQVLCSAITRGDIPTLHNLLRCGADANSLDYDRRAPLHIAAADGNLQAVSSGVAVCLCWGAGCMRHTLPCGSATAAGFQGQSSQMDLACGTSCSTHTSYSSSHPALLDTQPQPTNRPTTTPPP